MASDLAEKLRSLVDPKLASDKRVVTGCDLLYSSLSDDELVLLARLTVCDRIDVEDALRRVVLESGKDLEIDNSVALALIRFRVKAAIYGRELGAHPQSNREVAKLDNVAVPRTFAEGETVDEVMLDCLVHPDDANPISDLAFLLEVQKRRLIQQLREIGKAPTAFMANKQFNATVDSMRSLIKDMAQMQVDFGLRKKIPKQIDIRVQGAFQNFLSNVGDERDAMSSFSKSILSILEEDAIDVNDYAVKEQE